MFEGMSNVFREGDKLNGLSNFYVWSLKREAVMRGEGLWVVIKMAQNPQAYPATIDGEQLTKSQLKKKNAFACRLLVMFVADDIVDLVANQIDPTSAWKVLRDLYYSRNQLQILILMS